MNKSASRSNWGRKLVPWLFVLPGLAITILLRYATLGTAFFWSLHNVTVSEMPGKFIGVKNYTDLMASAAFSQSFVNTLVFVGLTFLICFPVPIIQALILNEIRHKKTKNWLSTLYIIPAVIPGTIVIVIWRWIWNPQYGIANYLLGLLNLPPQSWLGDPNLVKFCIVFPGILGGGFTVLLYFAAMLGVPDDIIEAASIDGCVGWRKIRFIILPNIKFMISVQVITTMIGTFQIADSIFQYTSGGPAGASNSLGLHIYKLFNEEFIYGQGSALSIILLVIIAVLTAVQLIVDKSSDN